MVSETLRLFAVSPHFVVLYQRSFSIFWRAPCERSEAFEANRRVRTGRLEMIS